MKITKALFLVLTLAFGLQLLGEEPGAMPSVANPNSNPPAGGGEQGMGAMPEAGVKADPGGRDVASRRRKHKKHRRHRRHR